MCIHIVYTQCSSLFCILKCALSAQTCKNLQIWQTLVDHLYLWKSPARTLIGPNGGQNGLKSKNSPKNGNCTCSWVALVESLQWVCHLFHLWEYQANTQGGWSRSSCPRAALCAWLYILREHQALIPWQNSEDMASSLQEAHTLIHTRRSSLSLSLSLSLSHTQRWRQKIFSSSSSLRLIVYKRDYVTTHI